MTVDSFFEKFVMVILLFNRRVKEIVTQHKGNVELELQQRSIEFASIIQRHTGIKSVKRLSAMSNIYIQVINDDSNVWIAVLLVVGCFFFLIWFSFDLSSVLTAS